MVLEACLNFIAARRACLAPERDPRLFDRALGTWAAAILFSRAFRVASSDKRALRFDMPARWVMPC